MEELWNVPIDGFEDFWTEMNRTDSGGRKKYATFDEAWTSGIQPVRRFMSLQIEATGNQDDIWLFLKYMPQSQAPENYEDVPLSALLPAFMLSELKTAFLIGFQIFGTHIILL